MQNLLGFHPEMVFLANLGVNLHVCLCGDLQVASAQTLDFLDIGQKSSFPDWKPSSTAKTFPDGDYLVSIRKSFAAIAREAGKPIRPEFV
ncbi:hypothetical protein TRIP_B40119 [uncultured Desulfatiglans sp.]|uniref:Uncharacterized protein n=1 Tax=Uncultured Desulfatiglans sp. TaxID=1748965 RepID=A0A653ADQ8_UNCDX|nr:hypothetical protein TRIP_B40119 [uncultured Desulfatiglans sp.]